MTNEQDLNLVLDDHPIFQEPDEETTPLVENPDDSGEGTPQEDESQYLITLDRRQLQQQLLDLVNQDPVAKQIYNRSVGNQAAKRYQPEINDLKQQVNDLRTLVRREQYSKLTQEEVNQKFTEDPNFAAEYARVIHSDVKEPDNSAIIEQARQQLVSGVEYILQSGASQGLTREDITEIWGNIQQGVYDKDESGADFPPSMWREVLAGLQSDVTGRIIKNRTNGAPPVEPPPVVETPPVNQPRGDTATPDLSQAGQRGVRTSSITMREFRALPIEEQISMIPDGDIERAVTDGRLIVEGLEGR